MGLNCIGSPICRFFPVNISTFYILGFNQLQIKNSIFIWRLGVCRCRRPTICIVFLPIYIRDLSILSFLICRVLEPIAFAYWEMTVVKFLGSQKLYVDFYCWGVGASTHPPSCSRVSCIIKTRFTFTLLPSGSLNLDAYSF